MAKRESNYTRILSNVLKAEPVYVRGTGIKAIVTDFEFYKGSKKHIVWIEFMDTPTKPVVQRCEQFTITVRDKNRNTLNGPNAGPMSVQREAHVKASINIDELSVHPYETKAAKILYKK